MRSELVKVLPRATAAGRARAVVADYWELTKPEVNFLVVTATLAGFYMGTSGAFDWLRLFHTLVGTGLVAGGTATLNEYLEREIDGRMRRTARRPLPAGRLRPLHAVLFGMLLALAGAVELALRVNLLASLLALLTLVSYLFAYTPLKKKTSLCTAVGAIPGAMPVLIGWAATGRPLEAAAWILYAILFFWQFPHFLSIALLYREDYARGGVVMLPPEDRTGRATARQIAVYSSALLAATLALAWFGLGGKIYFAGAILLSLGLFYFVLRLAATRSALAAKQLLHATVIYLPLLFGLMMVDKVPR